MQLRVMDIVDCNNHVKSASQFFGPSCAVDSLSDIYNPLGDNSDHLCELCASKVLGQRCTTHDPYAGYQVLIFTFSLKNIFISSLFPWNREHSNAWLKLEK